LVDRNDKWLSGCNNSNKGIMVQKMKEKNCKKEVEESQDQIKDSRVSQDPPDAGDAQEVESLKDVTADGELEKPKNDQGAQKPEHPDDRDHAQPSESPKNTVADQETEKLKNDEGKTEKSKSPDRSNLQEIRNKEEVNTQVIIQSVEALTLIQEQTRAPKENSRDLPFTDPTSLLPLTFPKIIITC